MKIFVIGGLANPDEPQLLEKLNACGMRVGTEVGLRGHDLLMCSPFEQTADVSALRGWATAAAADRMRGHLEVHLPDIHAVRERLDELLKVKDVQNARRFLHAVPFLSDHQPNLEHAWLLAQLAALDACHGVIAMGGRSEGTASLLLSLAVTRRVPVLPLGFLGGAAASHLDRHRFELADALGPDADRLAEAPEDTVCLFERLVERQVVGRRQVAPPGRFFISYPRERSAEADQVEALLRRRNAEVFRDDDAFEIGREVTEEIRRNILRSDVFVALYCREFMLSPWCFDELELAFERSAKGLLRIALLCLDGCRVVPPQARALISYPCGSRNELETRVRGIIDQIHG